VTETTATAARLAMTELTVARVEVEAATVTGASRAVAAELKTLHDSSISSSVSADSSTDDELKLARKAAREQAEQWAATHPEGHGGWVDGDHGLYRWCGSPSPGRYHGHRGIQTIVRDVGPGVGWPTLTKTNYVEWTAMMRIQLQI
jgi:hypothetical protein